MPLFADWDHELPECAIGERLREWEDTRRGRQCSLLDRFSWTAHDRRPWSARPRHSAPRRGRAGSLRAADRPRRLLRAPAPADRGRRACARRRGCCAREWGCDRASELPAASLSTARTAGRSTRRTASELPASSRRSREPKPRSRPSWPLPVGGGGTATGSGFLIDDAGTGSPARTSSPVPGLLDVHASVTADSGEARVPPDARGRADRRRRDGRRAARHGRGRRRLHAHGGADLLARRRARARRPSARACPRRARSTSATRPAWCSSGPARCRPRPPRWTSPSAPTAWRAPPAS